MSQANAVGPTSIDGSFFSSFAMAHRPFDRRKITILNVHLCLRHVGLNSQRTASHSASATYRVGQKTGPRVGRPTDAAVQNKMKRTSRKVLRVYENKDYVAISIQL